MTREPGGSPAEQVRGVYWEEALAAVPRLLGALDREPDSASCGCFDRHHWAWKLRDVPVTSLQLAAPALALVWRADHPRNRYYRSARLLAWIESSLRHTCGRQRGNGSFDSVGPYTQDHGVTLAMAYALSETALLLDAHLSREGADAVRRAVERACRFAVRTREDYAFISNHQALFALAFCNASRLLARPAYEREAFRVVEGILAGQSPDGWYREYEGPDPGYESLGIFYLAKVWQQLRSERLLESLRRSIDFLAHCVHPDGSIGGVYGSRHTALYFPAGLHMLAPHIPAAGAIARFVAVRLGRLNVVTPGSADDMNLAPLAHSYLEAALAPAAVEGDLPALPCEQLAGLRRFSGSGIVSAGFDRYYAVANLFKGGVIRVFDKQAERLLYEDAGYLVTAEGRRWTSQVIGLGTAEREGGPSEATSLTRLAEFRQELPTAGTFLVLRLLNLTAFRSVRIGGWLRRRIVRRLILRKRPGPMRLRRRLVFEPTTVRVSDVLESDRPVRASDVRLVRALTAIHMGSAKYFVGSDLEPAALPSDTRLAQRLSADAGIHVDFTIDLSRPPRDTGVRRAIAEDTRLPALARS